jgi:hypothetical protein
MLEIWMFTNVTVLAAARHTACRAVVDIPHSNKKRLTETPGRGVVGLEAVMTKLRILALTYKTFPAKLAAVHEATIDVLKQMGMRVLPNGSGNDGVSASILASGWRRELDVELEAQGVKGTRVRVLAKEGVFFEENAATDLIAQVTRLLEQHPDKGALRHATGERAPMAILSTGAQAAAVSG